MRLVGNAENGNDIFVLGLTNELGEDADVAQGTLSVSEAHYTIKYIDCAKTTLVTGRCEFMLGTRKQQKRYIQNDSIRSESREERL